MVEEGDPLPAGPLMLFDGLCNFCSGSAAFVLARSPGRDLRFCAMQSPRGQAILLRLGLPLTDFTTVALVEGGVIRTRSAAALGLAAYMDAPWPFLARIISRIPLGLRDWIYDWIAANRFRIAGRRQYCFVPDDEARRRFLI